MSTPIAVASIPLSEEQRTRIAAELGLGPDELDAVPTQLEIARYEAADDGAEVGGFGCVGAGFGCIPAVGGTSPIATMSIGTILTSTRVGRIPGSILIPG